MKTSSPEDLKSHVQDKNLCVNCGGCTNICPYFKHHNGKVSMIFPCTTQNGRCYANCPKIEVDLDKLNTFFHGTPYTDNPLGNYISVKMAKAGNAFTKGNFQNGGTVSSLVSFAIREKIIDAAVLTGHDGITPVPRIVTGTSDILNCTGSKYMASPTISVLNREIEGKYNKMGVVGTPCQMTALTQIKMNPLEKNYRNDSLELFIGLFCTWALDPRQFIQYLSSKINIKKIVSMDIPPPPAEKMIVKTKETTVEIPLDEVRGHILSGCFVCPDMTAEFSDISIGAFEDDPTYNTLIIRTQKGKSLVENAERKGMLILKDMPEKSIRHLSAGAENKKKRAFVKAGQDNILNTDATNHALIRANIDTINKIVGNERGKHAGK